ncbi:hypothetical protein QTO34_001875 [Cnephaeus nilssonii]|uniref:Uncharacterized protein n=1 Tax=Cnephaeus nilssonii TaxID=3371016 RepID=A0AA40HU14_CNENI|nr:hypothetical protein QTO34_001875 [Eptesicus nilssonii]
MESTSGEDTVKSVEKTMKDLKCYIDFLDQRQGLIGLTPLLKEVLLWIKCYQTSWPITEKAFKLRQPHQPPATHHSDQSVAISTKARQPEPRSPAWHPTLDWCHLLYHPAVVPFSTGPIGVSSTFTAACYHVTDACHVLRQPVVVLGAVQNMDKVYSDGVNIAKATGWLSAGAPGLPKASCTAQRPCAGADSRPAPPLWLLIAGELAGCPPVHQAFRKPPAQPWLSVLLAQSATPATLSPAPCASCWPSRGRSGVMEQTSRFLLVLQLERFPPTAGIRNHTLFQAKSDLSVVQ